jgi:hypothetical protein
MYGARGGLSTGPEPRDSTRGAEGHASLEFERAEGVTRREIKTKGAREFQR